MKSLVVYISQTGNTLKLAQAVFDALTGEKDIYPINEAPDPSGYDFIAVGFWLKGGKPVSEAIEYLSGIKGKSIFLFATHGAAAESVHAQKAMNYARDLAVEAKIAGTFSCQGEVSPDIIEKLQARTDPPEWFADAPTAKGHPDETDIEELKRLVVATTSAL